MSRTLLSLTLLTAACGFTDGEPVAPPSPAREVVAVEARFDEDEDLGEALVVVEAEPVVAPEAPAPLAYTLRRGEALAHFARWSGLPVEDIAEASGLALDVPLAVGTSVLVPSLEEGLASRIEVARDAHHIRRAEGYLASRGGSVGTEFYEVRTGDTAWSIAQDHAGLPVWLVESLNPSVDLERLRPGQELMLPVVADTVAQVE